MRGDFLLRLADRQSEDLIAQVRRAASAASWYCGNSAPAPALSLESGHRVAIVVITWVTPRSAQAVLF